MWFFSFFVFQAETEHLESHITAFIFLHLHILFENIHMKAWLKKIWKKIPSEKQNGFQLKKNLIQSGIKSYKSDFSCFQLPQ